MTIITINSDERIIDVWKRQALNTCPDANIKVLEQSPEHIIQLFDMLVDINDDVLYTLPVHLIHSTKFTDMLSADGPDHREFICFKQAGSPSMLINFFACTNNALKKIGELAKNRFKPDPNIQMGINVSNLVLNALGDTVEIINDNNQLVKSLPVSCNEVGQIATDCGSGEIMNMIAESKLAPADVVSHIMETLVKPNKNVEYRNK